MNLKRHLFTSAICIALAAAPPTLMGGVKTLFGKTLVREKTTDNNKAKVNRVAKAASTAKTGYGWLLFETVDEDYDEVLEYGYASIALSNGGVSVKYTSNDQACAGAYAGSAYYAYTGRFSSNGFTPKSFISLDPATGKTTVIKDYSQMTTMYNDMSYDYSTQTMYALGVNSDQTKSVLAKIDLTTGEYITLKELDRGFYTLAVTYAGEMYAISTSSELCKIDKTSGTVTVVGALGVTVNNYSQSMDFDHTDETLYWAETNKSGSNLYKIDITTGKATKQCTLGYYDDAQIVGLYIPFTILSDDIPAAPQNLTATPLSANAIKLSWKNPSSTKGGAALQSISKIVVTRNGEEIVTITDAGKLTPGAQVEYEDVHNQSGSYYNTAEYTVTAFNDEGGALAANVKSYMGEDYPGAVTNLKVEKVDGKIKLSWDAPTTGESGGWFDKESLTYKVRRGSDTLSDKVTETTYTDESSPEPGFYKYRITSQTPNKIFGGDTFSDLVFAGEADDVPQYYELTKNEFKKWNVIDNNDDGETWEQIVEDERKAAQMYAYESAADDWLVSRPLKLKAGKKYRVKFDTKVLFSFYPANLNVEVLKDGLIDSKLAASVFTEVVGNTIFENRVAEFSVPEDGEYSIAFHCASTTLSSRLYIANPAVEEFYEKDLAISNLVAPKNPIAGKDYKYTALVSNNGSASQSAYSAELVKIANGSESVLATVEGAKTLATNESETIVFNVKFTEESEFEVKVRVKLEGDQFADNNETAAAPVKVLPAGSDDMIEIGTHVDVFGFLPIGFVYDVTVAQTIYLKSDIDRGVCSIKKLEFPYKFNTDVNISSAVKNGNVKVYVGNTDMQNLTAGFIPAEQLTKVFDGDVSLIGDDTDHTLTIVFDKPYLYRGGNLCVMTEKRGGDTYTRYGGGYSTYDLVNKERTRSFDAYSIDTALPTAQGMTWDAVPDVTIYAEVDAAKLQGKVTDKGVAEPNATVTIKELDLTTTTDAEGAYKFEYVPEGTYTITVSNSSSTAVSETLTFKKGDSITKDFELSTGNVETLLSDQIRLYPVPADNALNIDGEYDRIKLVNYAGMTVFEADGGVSAINVGDLQSGVYHAVIESNGVSVVKKVIVRH